MVQRLSHASGTAPQCEFCSGSMDHLFTGDTLVSGRSYSVWDCPRCCVAQTIPKPTPEELGRLYATSQYRAEDGTRFIGPVETVVAWFNRIKTRSLSRYRSVGSILDIGCGRGIFLNILKKGGWRTKGVEFNAETASYASRVYGIDVVTMQDMDMLPEKSFDVITMYHVLEHVDRPAQLLAQCRRLLQEGGRLIIAVPNIASLQAVTGRAVWFHLDLPCHLYHFTPEGLLRLLREHGFSIESVSHLDLEQNPFGWLQTLLNRSGIKRNFLYDVLKQRSLRRQCGTGGAARDALLTLALLPVYAPLAVLLSIGEAFFKRGGTIEIAAVMAGAQKGDGRGGDEK